MMTVKDRKNRSRSMGSLPLNHLLRLPNSKSNSAPRESLK